MFSGFGLSFCQSVATAPLLIAADKNVCPSDLSPTSGINKLFAFSSRLSVNTCSISFDGSYIPSQSEKHSLIKSTVNNIIDCSFAGWPLLQSVDHQDHDEHRYFPGIFHDLFRQLTIHLLHLQDSRHVKSLLFYFQSLHNGKHSNHLSYPIK